MKDRIVQFLASEAISPAEFADKIGVQRSSMSHILNGRNYPSAAFIQKMLQAFATLNPRWLMIGDGNMYTNSEMEIKPLSKPGQTVNSNIKPDSLPTNSGTQSTLQFAEIANSALRETENQHVRPPQIEPKHSAADQKNAEILSSQDNIQLETKEIEQILFFFKDKTFSIYRPS
jgi:transcriptional regulator with XRE-family HTH domain